MFLHFSRNIFYLFLRIFESLSPDTSDTGEPSWVTFSGTYQTILMQKVEASKEQRTPSQIYLPGPVVNKNQQQTILKT